MSAEDKLVEIAQVWLDGHDEALNAVDSWIDQKCAALGPHEPLLLLNELRAYVETLRSS